MGSTKKHKRERDKPKEKEKDKDKDKDRDRKKRRRSKSSSPEVQVTGVSRRTGATATRRRRRHSSDVEEVPVDSHLKTPPPEKKRPKQSEPENTSSSKADSLSIEETNKLRAKLGLKPLQVHEEISAEDGKIKDDLGEFYHKPADNIADKKKQENLRAKIQEKRDKRITESKILNTVTLADSDGDDDADAWVLKSREIAKQKEDAAKRAAILDELDAEFGIGELAAEERRDDKRSAYTGDSLKGLKVMHDLDNIREDHTVILTLEDRDVLDDAGDVLINVNMKDNEKYKKSNDNKISSKVGYDPFEGADDLELYGQVQAKKVLSKYDEEIFGEKKPDGFVIGDSDQEEARKFKKMMIKQKLESKRIESLVLPELKIASQYYTEDEIKAKFKKPRKKGIKEKMRKKVKIEDIDEDGPTDALITDDTEVKVDDLKMEEDEEEDDNELELALAKSRRLKLAEQQKLPKLEDIVKKEESNPDDYSNVGGIVLDSTAEFCRTLGDIPTYGQAGNRDVDAEELMELERAAEADIVPYEKADGAWNTVDVDVDPPVDVSRDGGGALAAEPAVGSGLVGALQLALSKGYLERGREVRAPQPALTHLRAHNYSIEDKTHNEDDKLNRRERYSGPTSDFKEKDSFRPNVKLDYVDDDGRPLPPKEAFRYLSHKFHGKGPGKNKQEKRIKQNQQEGLMKKMSSTDTPLGTLALLQARQKESHAAYVVLSGAKQPRNAP